jgi:ABC-type antimicrobial peptide transport system permease subunit
MRPILGHTVVFQTHWGLFGLLLIVSFALAIVSSWIPMRHATKVNLLQVMSQE